MANGLEGFGIGDVNYGDWSDDSGQYSGGYYTDRPWWADQVTQAVDIFGRRIPGAQPRQPATYPYTQQYGGNAGFSPGSITQSGFNVNWQTIALVGVVAFAFFSGKRR